METRHGGQLSAKLLKSCYNCILFFVVPSVPSEIHLMLSPPNTDHIYDEYEK